MFAAVIAAPLITALAAWLAPAGKATERINLVGSIATAAAGIWLAGKAFIAPIATAGDALFLDALGAYLLSLVSVLAFLAAVYSVGYLRHDIHDGRIATSDLRRYYALYYLFWTTMNLVCISNNLGLLWVAIEATTLSSALLVNFYADEQALEAAWKYVILCTVGIAFALFGTTLMYASSVQALGTTSSALNWTTLMDGASQLDPNLVRLAFVFCLVGYGTKSGLAPLHNWLPDAHSQAPSPISAVLSGVLLNCALYGVLRFHLISSAAIGAGFSTTLLIVFGLASIAIAIPFIATGNDLKRLLAYSSVEHMGVIAVGIGLGSALAFRGAVLHMLVHGLAKSVMFFAAGSLIHFYGTRRIGHMSGAVQVMPASGPMFVAGALAITGVPPFGTFLSEWSIAWGAISAGNLWVAVALLVGLALIFASLAFHVLRVAFGPARRAAHQEATTGMLLASLLPLGATALLGLHIPTGLAAIIDQVVLVLQGGQ